MSEVGPDASGSNPGLACLHIPDKSGIDSALSLRPRSAVANATAKVISKEKFRHCKSIAASPIAYLRTPGASRDVTPSLCKFGRLSCRRIRLVDTRAATVTVDEFLNQSPE